MAASSSSTVDELPPKHQVFINYRGRDLRFGFVSHLFEALKHHNINVFIDDHEDKGQRLGFLLERIMDSTIALCIFSSKYTESVLCLTELTIIKKCLEHGKLVAIPVFYKLEPSTVRHMRGQFGDAFRNLTKSGEKKKKKWMEAVKSISQLIGITVHERSYEASAINEIVDNVQKMPRTITNSPLDGKLQPKQIQVFINFRGAQLRNNFIGYLVEALQKSEVNVFADNYLLIGNDLNKLFKKIEDSGIAIVVFSSRYTESKWCLEELVKIKERVSQGMLKVIPVFYKVTPTNVKKLKGVFGDNFRDREWEFESDEPKIKRWKDAIKFISHKLALTFDEESTLEIDFVNNIVKEVLKTLQAI